MDKTGQLQKSSFVYEPTIEPNWDSDYEFALYNIQIMHVNSLHSGKSNHIRKCVILKCVSMH